MAVRSGQKIPDRIANSPKIISGNEFYLECFYDLIDNVNWATVVSYCEYYNLTKETVDDLMDILPRLQSAYNDLRLKHNRNEG